MSTTITDVFGSIKSFTGNVWDGIKNTISDAIEAQKPLLLTLKRHIYNNN